MLFTSLKKKLIRMQNQYPSQYPQYQGYFPQPTPQYPQAVQNAPILSLQIEYGNHSLHIPDVKGELTGKEFREILQNSFIGQGVTRLTNKFTFNQIDDSIALHYQVRSDDTLIASLSTPGGYSL